MLLKDKDLRYLLEPKIMVEFDSASAPLNVQLATGPVHFDTLIPVYERRLCPRGSKQFENEHWKQYFERMEKRHDKIAINENAAEQHDRRRRRQDAKNGRPPAPSSRIFYWQDTSNVEGKGQRVRTPLARKIGEQMWDAYTAGQRRYDDFFDEWDICTDFDPGEPFEQCQDEYNYGQYDEYDVGHQHVNYEGFELDAAAIGRHIDANIQEEDLTLDEPVPDRASTNNEPIIRTVAAWYGFVEEPDKVVEVFGPVEESRWLKTCKVLREYSHAKRDEATVEERVATTVFVERYVKGVAEVPRTMLDVHDPPSIPKQDKYFIVYPSFVIADTKTNRDWPNPNIIYVVDDTSGQTEPWTMAVDRASTALWILRGEDNPCKTTRALAMWLMTKGAPFSIFWKGTQPTNRQPLQQLAPSRRLGVREQGYKPDIRDYKAYINAKRHLLLSPRVRSAALRKGGILWRLALDAFDEAEARRLAATLSYEADDKPLEQCRLLRIGGDEFLYDDELTDEEHDVLIGLYKVKSGKTETIYTPR